MKTSKLRTSGRRNRISASRSIMAELNWSLLLLLEFNRFISFNQIECVSCGGYPYFLDLVVLAALFNQNGLVSLKQSKLYHNYFEIWATSKLLGTTTKSCVFVFKAESSPFNFLKLINSKNFWGKIAWVIPVSLPIGIIFVPLANYSLASLTVKSL